MIYTSYFAKHKKDKNEKVAYISIAVGNPKYPVAYDIVDLKELKPFGIFRKYTGEEYKVKYFERLDAIGVEKIKNAIKTAQGDKEDAFLMCHEKNKYECHRSMFAEWWEKNTGEKIEEYGEEKKKKGVTQLSFFGII